MWRFIVITASGFHSVLSQPQLITAFLNNSFHDYKEKRKGYNLKRFLKRKEKKKSKTAVLTGTTKGVPQCLAVEAALQLEGVKSFVLKHLSCCGSNKSDSTAMF